MLNAVETEIHHIKKEDIKVEENHESIRIRAGVYAGICSSGTG